MGLIIVGGDNVDVRYSRQKLNALQPLLSKKEYNAFMEMYDQPWLSIRAFSVFPKIP